MRLVSLVWLHGTDHHPERVYPVATWNQQKIVVSSQEVIKRPDSRAVD
jgi:hypothetical protein